MICVLDDGSDDLGRDSVASEIQAADWPYFSNSVSLIRAIRARIASRSMSSRVKLYMPAVRDAVFHRILAFITSRSAKSARRHTPVLPLHCGKIAKSKTSDTR